MSWQANDAVRRYSRSKGNARLLMVFLSNYAGPHGEDCRPSIATLVADTGLAERTIRNLLEVLRKSGELIICYEAGPKRVNVYWFNLPEAGLKPPAAVLDRAKNGAIWPARKPRKGAESAPFAPEHTHNKGADTRTQGGKTGAARGQALAPDPSGSPSDPSVKESGAPARAINRVLKPKEVEAAEVAACPLWQQLEATHGGPAPAARRAEWLAERRNLLDRTGKEPGYWALLFPRLWATAAATWTEGMPTVPAVLRHAEDLEREGRRAMREATRLTRGLADGSIMPSEVASPESSEESEATESGDAARQRLATLRDDLARRAEVRAAQLARLGTDPETVDWWHRQVGAPPRLGPAFAGSVLVPPQEKGGNAALLFPSVTRARSAALASRRAVLNKVRQWRSCIEASGVLYLVESEVLGLLDGGEKGEVVAHGGDGGEGNNAGAGGLEVGG